MVIHKMYQGNTENHFHNSWNQQNFLGDLVGKDFAKESSHFCLWLWGRGVNEGGLPLPSKAPKTPSKTIFLQLENTRMTLDQRCQSSLGHQGGGCVEISQDCQAKAFLDVF